MKLHKLRAALSEPPRTSAQEINAQRIVEALVAVGDERMRSLVHPVPGPHVYIPSADVGDFKRARAKVEKLGWRCVLTEQFEGGFNVEVVPA